MSDTPRPIRIWYQGFTDPEIHGAYVGRLQAHLDRVAGPSVSVEFHGISPPARHLHAVEELRCSLSAMANAVEAEARGFDGFALGHFQEAGIHEIKSLIDIPAISLGEASMHFACLLARRFGLITIDPIFIPWHQDQVIRAGLSERVVGVRAMRTSPADYMRAFTDEAAYRDVLRQFREQAEPLLAQGADMLIPAGGLPMLLLSREAGLEIDGAPVLNGINALVAMTEAAVRLRRIDGIGVSRRSNYARPSGPAEEEFRAMLAAAGSLRARSQAR